MIAKCLTTTAAILTLGLPVLAADQGEVLPIAPAVQMLVADQKEGVGLTVYNGGYGVVHEIRKVKIGADGQVKFDDVPTAIDATTVHFRSLTDPAAKLLEQNYQFDLVSADKLLNKYIDQAIDVVCTNKTYSGTLLSYDANQLVVNEGGAIAMIQRRDNVRDIRFKMLPEGLLTRPTLLWEVGTKGPADQLAEVTYQTGGLNWHAEYVLVLAPGDGAADLSGWVSVENNSGKMFNNAKLKFIAGDVRRVQPPQMAMRSESRLASNFDGNGEAMQEKGFFEYHMYTLPNPSTVANNEVKQLEMFTPVSGLKVQKRYLYDPIDKMGWGYGGRYEDKSMGVTSDKKVQVFVDFKNAKENNANLGIPLPAGKVRVYKQDPDDKALEFIGEQQIDHTPKDENVSLQIGNAFDVVGERKQTKFKIESGRHWMQESIEVTLRNHKKEDVTVRVKEPLFRWTNWEITAKSQDYTQLDARTIAFDVPVKADGEATMTYTVDYSW